MRVLVRVFLLGLCLSALACEAAPQKPAKPPPSPVRAAEPKAPEHPTVALRPQPRPGQRVPQPELDGYCAGSDRPAAFYYHGGSPVVRLARGDGCTPLFITECESEGRCYPPRDQEPGMWCCTAAEREQQPAHATR